MADRPSGAIWAEMLREIHDEMALTRATLSSWAEKVIKFEIEHRHMKECLDSVTEIERRIDALESRKPAKAWMVYVLNGVGVAGILAAAVFVGSINTTIKYQADDIKTLKEAVTQMADDNDEMYKAVTRLEVASESKQKVSTISPEVVESKAEAKKQALPGKPRRALQQLRGK